MRALTETDIEPIILMAREDTIPFEVIEREYKLTANEVQKLMRQNQSKRPTAAGEKESLSEVVQVVNTRL